MLEKIAKAIFDAREVQLSKDFPERIRQQIWGDDAAQSQPFRDAYLRDAQAALDAMRQEWSDEVPTVPGHWWVDLGSSIEVIEFRVLSGLNIAMWRGHSFSLDTFAQNVSRWCRAQPPEGS